MNERVELWETPTAKEVYMIAGWRQWADAGAISSGLPEYLIDHLDARAIGRIKTDDFYLFQIPGTHHFLRPEIKLEDGYRQSLEETENAVYYAGDDEKGLVIFLGDEPHLNIERYAEAFFDVAQALNVKRIGVVGGVYGAMPYDKDRDVSCTYSMPHMKKEMETYSVRFSNYQGGATIGSYLVDHAEDRGMEFLVFYAFVPAYDFSEDPSPMQGIRLESDYRAWYELMRRFNHMFDLGVDLSELEKLSHDLDDSIAAKIDELEVEAPELQVRQYVDELSREFSETPFMPLDDIWEEELGDLFDDSDD